MKIKLKDVITYLICFVVAFGLAYCLVEYREARNEAMHRRLMCASVDIRLVKSGLVDCAGVETSVYK